MKLHMSDRLIRGAWGLAILGSLSLSAGLASGAPVAFENARLVVGDGRASIPNATLIIDGDRIVAAGRAGEVTVPPTAQRIDLAGKTVMPALIDTHVHVNQPREALVSDLRRLAYFGVGTVLSLGVDTASAPFEVRAQPLPGAARLLTAGRGITAPEPGRETAPYWVTTDQEARRAVQENVDRGVDMIKVWVDDRRGSVQKLAPPLYRAVIETAHRSGLRVTAHIYALDDAKGLLRAGVDAFAHSVRDRDVDEELLTLVRERPSLVLNPNLTARGEVADLSWLAPVLRPDELAKAQSRNVANAEQHQAFLIQARNLQRMKAAGARIVLGTDTSFDFPAGNTPWAAHMELEDMVAAGMTPSQAIVAATSEAAAFLRLPDVGTLQPGYQADLLVLEADPTESITHTRRIAAVYLRGVRIDRSAYPQ
nr:amidohydrolase family protein [uncultured Steroidobacter sp.]